MTKKKPKISYRDLSRDDAPPASTEAAVTVPDPIVVARSLTPVGLAVVLNQERRTPALGVPVIGARTGTPVSAPVIGPPPDAGSPAANAASLAATSPGGVDAPAERPLELLLFRVGGERFATPLADVEEAVDLPALHTLPESPSNMLGIFELRGELIAVFSPAGPLGARNAGTLAAAFVIRAGEHRVALAVDELDDVLAMAPGAMREPTEHEAHDGVLAGVATVDGHVVAVVDGPALARSCIGALTRDRPNTSRAEPEAA